MRPLTYIKGVGTPRNIANSWQHKETKTKGGSNQFLWILVLFDVFVHMVLLFYLGGRVEKLSNGLKTP